MELQADFNRRIDEIQRKLRECNYECNRLKSVFSEALAKVQPLNPLESELANSEINPLESIAQETLNVPLTVDVSESQLEPGALEAPESSTIETPSGLENSPVNPAPSAVEGPEDPEIEITTSEPKAQDRPLSTPPPIPQPRRQTNNHPHAAPSGRRKKSPNRKSKRREYNWQGTPEQTPNQPSASASSKAGLEKFIGENLLNKIGIGILVIGVGIFVKYAIDQDWIGHIGRVLVGLTTGGLLMGIAHRMRKKYAAFSSVLVGGGIATLYFTVAIAFQTYGLMSQTLAFGCMSVVTGFGVVMALGYNRQEIGVMALLGGFATPFMVSTGQGQMSSLFTYILVLNLGALALSWFRHWKTLRILSYGLTTLMFVAWQFLNFSFFETPETGAFLLFGTLFFLVFFGMHIAFSVRKKTKLKPIDFLLLLSNSAVYYATTMLTMYQVDEGRYMGIFTALMGLFHFAFVFPARKWVAFDPRLVTVLIGMVLTFVTAAVGIQLEGSYLTVFWSLEAVILLVLARRTDLKVLQNASSLVALLAILSLSRDWYMAYLIGSGTDYSPVLNPNFLNSLVAAGSMFGLSFLKSQRAKGNQKLRMSTEMFRFFGIVLLYLGMVFEVVDHVEFRDNPGLTIIGLFTVTGYYLVGMHLWARFRKQVSFGNVVSGLSVFVLVLYGLLQLSFFAAMRQAYLEGTARGEGYMYSFLMIPALFALLGLSFDHARRQMDQKREANKLLYWTLSVLLVFLSSATLSNVLALNGVEAAHVHKVGYPILWGILGFVLVASGMRYKVRHLRLAGLSLFLLIMVKLFAYDIRSIPTAGKIAAFISLGVVLLVVSFLYQRLKRLVAEDDPEGLEQAS